MKWFLSTVHLFLFLSSLFSFQQRVHRSRVLEVLTGLISGTEKFRLGAGSQIVCSSVHLLFYSVLRFVTTFYSFFYDAHALSYFSSFFSLFLYLYLYLSISLGGEIDEEAERLELVPLRTYKRHWQEPELPSFVLQLTHTRHVVVQQALCIAYVSVQGISFISFQIILFRAMFLDELHILFLFETGRI